MPSIRLPWPLLLVLIAALGWAVERIVVTDREAVEEVLSDAAEAFDRGDLGALDRLLDPEFVHDRTPREEAVQRLAALAKRFETKGTTVAVRSFDVEGDGARAEITVRVRTLGQVIGLSGTVRLVRAAEGWRIRAAERFGPGS